MKIGIVTFWSERGAAYVSRQYQHLLSKQHQVVIYARGWTYAEGNEDWDGPTVTWGKNSVLPVNSAIHEKDFHQWLEREQIEAVLFNEQHWWPPVKWCTDRGILTGAYIDYYTEATIPLFANYDFLICNTKRHFSAFDWHPQAYYVPWGTDVNLFKPTSTERVDDDRVVFFQSCGFSPTRKGTDFVLKAFAQLKNKNLSLLRLHSQVDLGEKIPELKILIENLIEEGRLEIIHKTVAAPGLYHLGDVNLAPSRLEGIGLPMAEALACGLPLITVDNAPMNEFVSSESGKVAKIDRLFSRPDGYYWPQCQPSISSLADCMQHYVDYADRLPELKAAARDFALKNLNWWDRDTQLNEIFTTSQITKKASDAAHKIATYERQQSGIRYKVAKRYPFWYGTLQRMNVF